MVLTKCPTSKDIVVVCAAGIGTLFAITVGPHGAVRDSIADGAAWAQPFAGRQRRGNPKDSYCASF